MTGKITTANCLECGAKCCNYVATEIGKPTCKRDCDHIRWFLLHEDTSVFVCHDGDWHVEFGARCSWLGDDNLCKGYEKRPKICRQHGNASSDEMCEFADEPHSLVFHTVDEFEKYLDDRGMDWQWKDPDKA